MFYSKNTLAYEYWLRVDGLEKKYRDNVTLNDEEYTTRVL